MVSCITEDFIPCIFRSEFPTKPTNPTKNFRAVKLFLAKGAQAEDHDHRVKEFLAKANRVVEKCIWHCFMDPKRVGLLRPLEAKVVATHNAVCYIYCLDMLI